MAAILTPFFNKRKIFEMIGRTRRWQSESGIRYFDDLNLRIATSRFTDLIAWSEAVFNRQFGGLWDRFAPRAGKTRLICIAGPSSSGKTTFSFRLCDMMASHGIRCIPLSLDDYFHPRDLTPKDENGEYDFEDINAIDLALLNRDLESLIAGREIQVPSFNFKTGQREAGSRPMRLGRGELVIIEGIHGLNGLLTKAIPDQLKFKIYLTAMIQIRNHKGHFLHSTDHRFIRRIVRDSNYRGYDAATTIRRWPSVTRGERRNIFPFQDEAHYVFNSALVYEYPVLKRFAFDLLVEINKNRQVFIEARKLLSVLNYFDFAPESSLKAIPKDSVLREFIGGSRYEY